MLRRPRLILVGALTAGAGALTCSLTVSAAPEQIMARSPTHGRSQQAVAEARARAACIQELLTSLPAKSTREKLEAVYDGAVHTHEIGFPGSKARSKDQSLSRPN